MHVCALYMHVYLLQGPYVLRLNLNLGRKLLPQSLRGSEATQLGLCLTLPLGGLPYSFSSAIISLLPSHFLPSTPYFVISFISAWSWVCCDARVSTDLLTLWLILISIRITGMGYHILFIWYEELNLAFHTHGASILSTTLSFLL